MNIAAVTPVLQWVHYLSVFFFGFESLIVNEMSGISLIFSVSRPIPPPLFFQTRHLSDNTCSYMLWASLDEGCSDATLCAS